MPVNGSEILIKVRHTKVLNQLTKVAHPDNLASQTQKTENKKPWFFFESITH